MSIEPKESEKFQKLGCSGILCLACIAPHGYEDHRLHDHVLSGAAQLVDATVEAVSRTPKTLLVTLYAHNLSHKIEAVLFRPKPYMQRQFSVGERAYYYGKIEFRMGHAQMNHPQKVASPGQLMPRYKTALRSDEFTKLVAKYLTRERLAAEGLSRHVVDALLTIHFPHANVPYSSVAAMPAAYSEALKFTELFEYMRQLAKKRRFVEPLHALMGEWRNWAAQLPFVLTSQQVAAIEAIEADLKGRYAARRMVVGDVGSGKTMVILAAALIAQPHTAILMAPTTILANQLFEEAQKHLPLLKSTLVTNKSKKASLEGFDFIIGTHALLHRELPDAALVMIDEQHRFGTAQRHALQAMIGSGERHPHFLQFSATPIPRTQAMIDSAQIDVSLITETPFEKNIDTKVIGKSDFTQLMAHIKAELALERQVLIVYPLVEQSDVFGYQSIEEARGFWENRFENVHVTHGRDKEKEEVLLSFREKGTILLATTVVEVGISLPRLSTVVIVGAERLGLSTLHQLRGRVSRTGLQGYCYLFSNQKASTRLEAFCHTDNGFDIAALDLKFRQSGDLLMGKVQSGKKFVWVDLGEDEKIVQAVKASLRMQRA